MKNLLRRLLALAVAVALGTSPVLAAGASPEGLWQTTDRNMDFGLNFCGDGKQICMTLIAARKSGDTANTRKYVGKYVLRNAKPAGQNVWKGSVNLLGHSGSGTFRFTPGVSFVISGCAYFVVCQDFTLIPGQ